MPAIHHDFDRSRNRGDQVMRCNRGRSNQRSSERSPPLKTLVIKTLSMIMVGVRVDGCAKVNVREIGRRAACQQDDESGHTHNRGAVRYQSANAFPERPDKRHVYTPLRLDDSTPVLVRR